MNYFLFLGIILLVYMNIWFAISLILRRNDVADIAWGIGFVLLAWTAFITSENPSSRALIVNILVTIWGLRLAIHIQSRNTGKQEDYRYAAWRAQWGKWFLVRSYFQVFILQGVLLYIIALPILWINKYSGSVLNLVDLVGFIIWCLGFTTEAVADYQLVLFKRDSKNKGRLMRSGLWKYSRHPNYFGEVLLWWGVFVMALSVTNGWITVIGPIAISMLILYVSGIPMLERKLKQHPDFAEYASTTSRFIPLPKLKLND